MEEVVLSDWEGMGRGRGGVEVGGEVGGEEV